MKNFYTNVTARGNDILFRGIVDGKRKDLKIKSYKPTLYISTNEKTDWRTIDGKSVAPIQPGFIKDCREFVDRYKDVSNFDVYGMTDYAAQWISDNYENEIEYDERLVRIFNLDIEVESRNGFPDPEVADQILTAVTIKDSLTNKYYVWACKEYTGNNKDIVYTQCKSEEDLINSVLLFWYNNAPDVVTGWNCRFFDIAYFVNRMKVIGLANKIKLLSPWGVVSEKNITIQGTTKQTYEFLGVTIMDALELYKKYTYTKQESYKLAYIARVEELGVEKLTYTGTLDELYENDFNHFIDYNIGDVIVVDKLLEKHKFINIVLGIAYKSKVNWQTVYSPVTTWDIFIYNYFKKKNIAIPPEKNNSKAEQYEGAFVKEPLPGKYKWVVSLDLDSLYPNAARQWNISPDTLIDEYDIPADVLNASMDDLIHGKTDLSFAKQDNVSFTANKVVFRKDFMGVLPDLFGQLYNERKLAKQKMIEQKKILQTLEEEAKKRGIKI